MGDEPLNPYLPKRALNRAIDGTEQEDIETDKLYEEASKKFDIFHIAVNSPNDCYMYHEKQIKASFGQLLGLNFKVSTIDNLSKTIEDCISESVNAVPVYQNVVNKNGEISW